MINLLYATIPAKMRRVGPDAGAVYREYPAALDGDDNLVRELAYCKANLGSLSEHKLSME